MQEREYTSINESKWEAHASQRRERGPTTINGPFNDNEHHQMYAPHGTGRVHINSGADICVYLYERARHPVEEALGEPGGLVAAGGVDDALGAVEVLLEGAAQQLHVLVLRR